MREPESVEECLYFSKREFAPGKGRVFAWAFRKECPKCHKALMKKPKKTAKEYVCPACGFSEPKAELEGSVVINIKYKCPFCDFEGEATSPYKRKSLYGKPAYVFVCKGCGEKLGLWKKMNTPEKFLEKINK